MWDSDRRIYYEEGKMSHFLDGKGELVAKPYNL
jgi:hypothetical protein